MTDGTGNYGSYERCRVLALRPLSVYTEEYNVETGFDYLTVNGVKYGGTWGPSGVKMAKGAALQWYSDSSGNRAGWKVCAQDTMTTAKPTKKGRYFPPSARRILARHSSPHLALSHLSPYDHGRVC